ncbi:serine/arginine repetitive matrix protein 1-like isoform X1 [Portunus trituberculatus]|uniref:serine/arginine repetitive matrix protein 1-like isoform X1 n=1 Tax=Portunus trituberculatus TaxID=210409 RepID=UPI001E1CE940|nr:serine/arginine repetitive matrix protein 1-like isoform X1 [Portunus trituberculatus]XP_045109269.1 serine/arginine repetitive matrix protein 1-like isoform X1 [Portunus trituberculatus]
MIFYSLNFPIKKPLNTVPPAPPLASPTPHPPPPPSPPRPRLQESRGERILRSAHAQQQDSTRMCRGSRWLTASRRTLSPRPAPASRPPRTPAPHARCSGILSCRAHTATGRNQATAGREESSPGRLKSTTFLKHRAQTALETGLLQFEQSPTSVYLHQNQVSREEMIRLQRCARRRDSWNRPSHNRDWGGGGGTL